MFGVGLVVAFVSAFMVIRWLIRYVATHDFKPFAWYRIAFGLVVIATGTSAGSTGRRSIYSSKEKPMKAIYAGVVLALVSTAAAAQSWPAKPLRLVVPLAPGSTADIVSRVVGTELAKALGQPVVVENKLGAGGSIAMAEVARAAPDGYTFTFASQGTLVFNQALYASPGYDSLKDFSPLAFVGGVSNVMIVHPSNAARAPARRGGGGEGQARHAHVLLGRRRNQPPPVRRAVRADDRNAAGPRAVQADAGGDPRGDDRRGRDGLLQHADRDRPDPAAAS